MRAFQASAPSSKIDPQRLRAGAVIVLLAATLTACSGAPNTEACGVVGREQTCPCEGSAIGIQACQLDGTWEACTCYPLSAGALAAGRSAAAGSSGGAGSSAAAGSAGAAAGSGGSGIRGLGSLFAGRPGARRP